MAKLTREELFELVWTTPMSKLAARFGVSGVALAKTCTKYDIPRPGRGYWQQLAVGISSERPNLPASEQGAAVVLARVPLPGTEVEVSAPTVSVPERLTDPHPAVRWLGEAFSSTQPDHYGRLAVRNNYGPAFCISSAQVPRLLRILDGVAKALTERGHEVVVARRSERMPLPDILVRSAGEEFAFEAEERLDQRPHTPTKEEKRQQSQSAYFTPPQYEYFASGALKLKLMFTSYKYAGQKSWSDTQRWCLDDLLGRVVLAVERAAHIGRVEREEEARLAEERRIAEMRRLRGERLRWYRGWLVRDLERTIDDHERAVRIRSFIEEHDRRLPPDARTETARRWSESLRARADHLDPLTRVTEVAKELEPSDEVLARLVAEAEN